MRIAVKTTSLQAILARRGLTQSHLARMVRCGDASISRTINGVSDPGISLRNRLMAALGLGFDDLFEIVNERREAS